jgi:hypothetical protein
MDTEKGLTNNDNRKDTYKHDSIKLEVTFQANGTYFLVSPQSNIDENRYPKHRHGEPIVSVRREA